jgi:gliding motility-associated-like protein
VYDVHLTASVAGTGQKDEWAVTGLRIFDVPKAAFELRSPLIYVPDNNMEVLNFSMGANQYSWDFGDGQSSDVFEPVHAFEKDGKYQVILVVGNDYGMADSDGDSIPDMHIVCTDTATREVVAIPGGELNIPNAFTPDTNGPNGGRITEAGYNDVFLPAGKGLITFHMQIYDRWGRLIYESHDKEVGWDGYDRDGRLMPAGVYVYKVMARTSKGETVTRAGDVALIR